MPGLLCFVIENRKLYFCKALAYFNDIPIAFICKDEGNNKYVVLCDDMDHLSYIIFKMPEKIVKNMLSNKISIRKALLSCDVFYEVSPGSRPEKDKSVKKPIDKIDEEILPKENVFYEKRKK